MTATLRVARAGDGEVCGRICHDAFEAISERHGFPKDLPSREVGALVTGHMIEHPGIFGVVAEVDGEIAGSNFLDERNPISAVGPITVDPERQAGQIGRLLMQAVLDRAEQQGAEGVRLMQDTFNTASLALYTKLGFRARMTTAVMQGPPLGADPSECGVRAASAADAEVCNQLCARLQGFDRRGELVDAIAHGQARVVERGGRVTGYTTGLAFFSHSVGEENRDLEALIAAASGFGGPGFHVPTGNDALLRWCFEQGLRVVKAMTLMTIGPYEPAGAAYLPSVGY